MMVVHTTAEDVYTRMWCVHEVDEALEAGIRVRGAMSQQFRAQFVGPASERLLDLRTESASCRCPADELMLRAAIEAKPGGFGRLDEVILKFRRQMFAAEEAAMLQQAEVRRARERRRALLPQAPTETSASAVAPCSVVSARRALRSFAAVLRGPASGSAFEVSHGAAGIDYFVSHSWQTPWRAKAWALLYTMSLIPAVAVAMLSDVAVHVATRVLGLRGGVLHFCEVISLDARTQYCLTANFIVACITFPLMLVLAPHVPGLLRMNLYISVLRRPRRRVAAGRDPQRESHIAELEENGPPLGARVF
ncbi:unnamed protein product [Prorocentrum cordatum]|uniref:Uncharacterized protein n=1 Tax=Prorocentrum cordatum TaxID=2364126 RepID=A0ABN9VKW2_9DINO|nr:unnamed protein product [Polarella glacialis]